MVGFRTRNQDSLPATFKCTKCSLLLSDPHQLTDCGHHICSSCADDEQPGDTIECPLCHERMPRAALKRDRGVANDMRSLAVTCVHCEWSGALGKFPHHLQQVHANPICEHCQQHLLCVDALNRHQLYACEKVAVDCRLRSFGCQEQVPRAHLNEHYRSGQHQLLLTELVRLLTSSGQWKDAGADSLRNAEEEARQFSEVMHVVAALSECLPVLKADLQRLESEFAQKQIVMTRYPEDATALKSSVEQQNSLLTGIVASQGRSRTDLEAIQMKMPRLTAASHDGTIIWKIVDIATGNQQTIDSPVFYTSVSGYSLRLRLSRHEDASAKSAYFSLSVILLQGEYDAILKFPFEFPVMYCLYDQVERKNHIIGVVRSKSAERPTANTNILCGTSRLVHLPTLQQQNSPYVCDNTMFIKAMVDFIGTPDALLLQTLGLDAPGKGIKS